MRARVRIAAGAGALALGLASAGGAAAAVISRSLNQDLSSIPVVISFGGSAAGFAFTAASTGSGPGAAVATTGTGMVSSFFGGVSDFEAGSTIDQTGEVYGFSAFPAATTIPNSPADDFIGLAATLSDGVHYGFAEVAGPSLVGYAFESSPNASITTAALVPEPASLALVFGAVMAAAVTRRRVQG